MPSGLTHFLIPSASLYALRPRLSRLTRGQWSRLVLLAGFLGNFPDLDLVVAIALPARTAEIHRAWGHNLFFVSFGILLGRWLLLKIVGRDTLSRRASWVIPLLLVSSHLLLDSVGAIPKERPGGIPLLFPMTRHEFRLPIEIFKQDEITVGEHPVLGHLTSPFFWKEVVLRELIVCALFLSGIFLYARFSKSREALPAEAERKAVSA